MAERAFDIDKSSCMCLIDGFNEIVTRALIKADRTIKQRLKDTQGKLVQFGVLLDRNNDFSMKYKLISDIFRQVHNRRRSIPEAHPYEISTTKRAFFVRTGERNFYYGQLKNAYLELDKVFLAL